MTPRCRQILFFPHVFALLSPSIAWTGHVHCYFVSCGRPGFPGFSHAPTSRAPVQFLLRSWFGSCVSSIFCSLGGVSAKTTQPVNILGSQPSHLHHQGPCRGPRLHASTSPLQHSQQDTRPRPNAAAPQAFRLYNFAHPCSAAASADRWPHVVITSATNGLQIDGDRSEEMPAFTFWPSPLLCQQFWW